MEDATRKWADANGRNVESLTSAEKQLAFYNAVVEDARKKVAGLGEEQIKFARDRWIYRRGLATVDAIVAQNQAQVETCRIAVTSDAR